MGITEFMDQRVAHTTFLGPDVLDAVLQCTRHVGMTLERFRELLPLEWSKQRELFGFFPL